MVAGWPHGKWQSKWIPPNAKCNCTQMLIFHLLCIQNLFFFAADVHLFYCPVLPHYIWNESTFSMNPRESIIRFGVVCVYKCGSNEVVSPVTTLPALRGSLIYHSNAPPPAFYLSLPWTAYTSGWWFLKLWALRCWGGVLGWWQGQMGSVMGHSHHRRPPPACCRDRLEKQGGRRALPASPCLSPQNCFDLGLAFHLTPNCDSFPLPSPRTQIISGVTQGLFQKNHGIGGFGHSLFVRDMMVMMAVVVVVVMVMGVVVILLRWAHLWSRARWGSGQTCHRSFHARLLSRSRWKIYPAEDFFA